MKRAAGLASLVIPTLITLSCFVGTVLAQNATEQWKAEFSDSLGQMTAVLTLTRASDGSFEGQYTIDSRRAGEIVLKSAGDRYTVALNQVGDCPGSFSGNLFFDGDQFFGNYAGTDCHGSHRNGTLTIVGSSSAEQVEQSSGPYGVVNPTTLNFGDVLLGQTSPQQIVSLKNTGDSELIISNISISGDFALPVNRCAAGVKPGTHCNVYVTFTPHSLGTETGTLTFTDNASNSPQTVSLTGVGSSVAPTTTTITASSNAIYAGQSVTFTATVTSAYGAIPDGEQVLFQGPTFGGEGTLHAGVASFTTSAVVWAGTSRLQHYDYQKIIAQYQGDQNFSSSKGAVDVLVQRYAVTSGYVAGTPDPIIYCQPFNLSAYVFSNAPVPPSGVVGLEGLQDVTIGQSVPYKDGCREFTRRIMYEGDAYTDWGYLSGLEQTFNPTTTTTSIKSSKNPSAQGQPVTLTVTLKAPYAPVVYGSVTLTSGGITLGTMQLSNSRGSITTSSLPVGQNTITATYTPGNGNYLSSEGSFVQTVQ